MYCGNWALYFYYPGHIKKKKLYSCKNSQCLQIVSTKLINIFFLNKAAKKHLTICIDVKEQSTTWESSCHRKLFNTITGDFLTFFISVVVKFTNKLFALEIQAYENYVMYLDPCPKNSYFN